VTEFSFTIEGRPATWQRTNHVLQGKRLIRKTPKKAREAKRRVHMSAWQARPRGWPLDAEYEVVTVGYWPDRRYGDVDRLSSLVMDGLEGVLYAQDRQVVAQSSRRYLDKEHPRTEVTVRVLEGDE